MPPASPAVTASGWPSACAGLNGTVNWPSVPAVAVPSTVPSAAFTLTVAPGSAEPVTSLPSALTATPVGAAAAPVSGAVTLTGALVPPASPAVTASGWPSVKAGLRATVKVPSLPAMAVAVVPSAKAMVTVEPASALPVTLVPSALTATSVGTAGAVSTVKLNAKL